MTTAERIYSASTSEDAASARLAEKLARQIEDDIASSNAPAGGVVGSLRELSERYSVGRAAAREAVALLERRGLGRLRPGPCGGFIVAQPDMRAIAAEIANYFRMVGITRAHLHDAREAVDLMAAGFVAGGERGAAELARLAEPADFADPLSWHRRLRGALANLTGEPAIALFTQCLDELTGEFALPAENDLTWRDTAVRLRGEMLAALQSGDGKASAKAAVALNADLTARLGTDDAVSALPSIETARQADDRTLATLVARRISAEILRGRSAGQRLGSEWDLCERYSVSRSTLRQAIRQLQDSGLVECRRGRGNGLVVRDLRGTGSIRLVLAYLISHQMDPTAAGTILFQLNRFVPALAIDRADVAQRVALRELLPRAHSTEPIDRYDLLSLVQYVSLLSDSPIIDLFSRCLAAYEARFHPFLAERLPAAFQAEYFDLLRGLLQDAEEGPFPLERAKRASSAVMLGMSRDRPI